MNALSKTVKIATTKSVLFICTANKDRSRTAEILFQGKTQSVLFRSAGINKYLSERHGGVHVKEYMLNIADRIICMEICHYDWIIKNYGDKYSSKMEILHLGDTDTFMSASLINKLEAKFSIK